MADAAEERYTIKEISVASGIPTATLNSRRKRMGMEGNDEGYTLAAAKLLVRRPRRGRPFGRVVDPSLPCRWLRQERDLSPLYQL